MYILYAITGLLLIISFFKDYKKTVRALTIALKKLINIFPAFVIMLILVSISLFFIPESTISSLLNNENRLVSFTLAALLGSLTLMPGFIVYPLCGLLVTKGISYMVLSVFSTTLMMVGILTFPIEKEYFGIKVGIIRNVISFMIALIVAVITGLFYGEIIK